jgi:hypothetical protein
VLSNLGEWFWRGRALERAQVARRQPRDLKALQTVVDLREASESIGFATSTALAQRLILSAALTQLEGLRPGEGPLLERDDVKRLLAARLGAKIVDGARRAFAAEAPEVHDTVHAFEVVRTLVKDARHEAHGASFVHLQRWTRVSVLLVAVVTVVGLVWVWPWWLRNKAQGARWHASSAYNGWKAEGKLGWTPSDAFFHTNEEDNPWLIVDLGRERSVSRVRVVNRVVGAERSLPLELEVSKDETAWQNVGTRTAPFQIWIAEFPAVEARYLRFRVPRKTFLHLRGIQVI